MGCAMGTVRYILFFFNFLLALAGLVILGVGVVAVYSENHSLSSVLHGQVSTPAVVFSIVGGCIFIFAFFGCCGALRESHCMVCTYAVLLLTLFVVQVGVAVVAYVYEGQAKDAVSQDLQSRFRNYQNSTTDQQFVDTLQQELKCCGSTDVTTPWASLGISAPLSCYANNSTSGEMFKTGCIPSITEFVQSKLTIIGRVAIGVAVVEVVGIIFSMCLASSIRRAELRGYA